MFALFAILAAAAAEPTPVMKGAHAPEYVIANGKGSAKLLLNQGTGSNEAAVSILTLQPGAEVPEHVHEKSAEYLYIEAGSINMTIAGKPAHAVVGDAIYIPANTKHSAKISPQSTAVRAIQIYVGPGPEQRFTKGPRK